MRGSLPDQSTLMLYGGVVLLALVAYVAVRGARNAATDIGQVVGSAAVGVAGGVVVGVGDAMGVPKTNASRCAAAKAARNVGDIGLYCPAIDYIKALPDLPAAIWNDLVSVFE